MFHKFPVYKYNGRPRLAVPDPAGCGDNSDTPVMMYYDDPDLKPATCADELVVVTSVVEVVPIPAPTPKP